MTQNVVLRPGTSVLGEDVKPTVLPIHLRWYHPWIGFRNFSKKPRNLTLGQTKDPRSWNPLIPNWIGPSTKARISECKQTG